MQAVPSLVPSLPYLSSQSPPLFLSLSLPVPLSIYLHPPLPLSVFSSPPLPPLLFAPVPASLPVLVPRHVHVHVPVPCPCLSLAFPYLSLALPITWQSLRSIFTGILTTWHTWSLHDKLKDTIQCIIIYVPADNYAWEGRTPRTLLHRDRPRNNLEKYEGHTPPEARYIKAPLSYFIVQHIREIQSTFWECEAIHELAKPQQLRTDIHENQFALDTHESITMTTTVSFITIPIWIDLLSFDRIDLVSTKRATC